MPALSKKQQKFMGIVRSIQKGEQPASKFSKDAQDVAKDMKKKDVKKFASTKHKGLPMKKEVLRKLKELIRKELSEYTYGVGDVVKDDNPTCPHYGAQGKVKSVNPRSVVFVVMNKGKNFKPGMELEKSHDQMKKMNEAITGSNRKELLKIGKEIKDNLFRINPALKKVSDDRLLIRGLANTFMFMRYTPDNANYKNYKKYFPKNFKSSSVQKLANILQNEPETVRKTFFKQVVKESINEMSAKSKKIINKLGKKEKEVFLTMVDMLGFDQVMSDYKRDKKAFKQALKDMSEGVISERDYKVNSGKEYSKNFLGALELVIRQANNLKGALAKHPIKRDINKLKAIQNLYKRFLKPTIDQSNNTYTAVDTTQLKKYLQDGKFKSALEYEIKNAIDSRYMSHNYFGSLDDKQNELRKRIVSVILDLVNKMDKAQLENINEDESVKEIKVGNYQTKYFHMCPGAKGLFTDIESKVDNMDIAVRSAMLQDALFFIEKHILEDDETGSPEGYMLVANNLATNIMAMAKMMGLEKEHHYIQGHIDTIKKALSGEDTKPTADKLDEDGHTDVASSKRKVMIMVDDSNKLLNKLNGMNKEDSLPSWWSDKITLSQNYLEKATNYLLNPVESVNENLRPSDKKILMVIATELVKTQMKGKNKNKIRKELPNILSTMGTNDFSKKSPTNRFNKNKMISLGKGFDKLSDSDKKVFINTLMYNAGLAESVNESKEPEVITQLRDIVKRQTNKKIKDPKTKKTMRVDMFTASAITQVYDAVKKTSHKSKFESLPLDKMAQLSFKMMK
jgi:hypothetical protein